MASLVGGVAILVGLAIAAVLAWQKWGANSTAGQTTVGKAVTAGFDKATALSQAGVVLGVREFDAVESNAKLVAYCDEIVAAVLAYRRPTVTPTPEQLAAAVAVVEAAKVEGVV